MNLSRPPTDNARTRLGTQRPYVEFSKEAGPSSLFKLKDAKEKSKVKEKSKGKAKAKVKESKRQTSDTDSPEDEDEDETKAKGKTKGKVKAKKGKAKRQPCVTPLVDTSSDESSDEAEDKVHQHKKNSRCRQTRGEGSPSPEMDQVIEVVRLMSTNSDHQNKMFERMLTRMNEETKAFRQIQLEENRAFRNEMKEQAKASSAESKKQHQAMTTLVNSFAAVASHLQQVAHFCFLPYF